MQILVADDDTSIRNLLKRLQGLLPICAYCKKIRDDKDYWHGVDQYLTANAEMMFSHSICPDCYETITRHELEDFKRQQGTA
jgi:hypothetical protein